MLVVDFSANLRELLMNTIAEIDRFPVSALPERYDWKKTALYERLKALKIQPIKVGNKAFISGSQLAHLDSLSSYLEAGGNVSEFLRDSEDLIDLGCWTPDERSQALALPPVVQFMPPPSDGFDNYRILTEAASQGWVLPTSKLLPLLELRQIPKLDEYGLESFERWGFKFKKVRKGRESEWRVEKV